MDAWAWFDRWPGGPVASAALILQGTADRIVDPKATVTVARKMSGDVMLKTWEGFYHILHEAPERDEVLGFIARWMEQHLA
jgi:alpha-beta hydrolase superfamily lysophospholipase